MMSNRPRLSRNLSCSNATRRFRGFWEFVMAPASFDGLRILSLESRRSSEMTKLIRTYGGGPFVVPAMREVSLESNRLALEFVDRLIAGDFDLVIFLTGVGMRSLVNLVEE